MKTFLLSLSLMLLSACGSTKVLLVNSEVDDAYALLAEYKKGEAVISDLHALMTTFVRYDEQLGIWDVSLLLSQNLVNQNIERASFFANKSLIAANRLKTKPHLFASNIQLYKVTNNKKYLLDATTTAESEFQLNMIAFLNGKASNIKLSDESKYSQSELAYTLYWLAKSCLCMERLHKAYELFRLDQNVRGVADSLFLMAKIYARNGDEVKAKDTALRAYDVLLSIELYKHANAINKWIKELNSVR